MSRPTMRGSTSRRPRRSLELVGLAALLLAGGPARSAPASSDQAPPSAASSPEASSPGPGPDLAPTGAARTPGSDAERASSEPSLGPELDARVRSILNRRRELQRGGMIALGAWALGNVAVGLPLDLAGDEEEAARHFHRMNWMWGAVNGVIASIGIASAFSETTAGIGYAEAVERARTTELVYLVNGVLDLSYLAVGAWLWERGLRTDEVVLEGFGQSLVLQGGFLLAFDGVMFGLSRTVSAELSDLPVRLVPVPGGAGVAIRF